MVKTYIPSYTELYSVYTISCMMRVKLLEQGLVVLQVASTSMETQDTHENILVVRKVGHSFDVFNMGMLKNTHTC